MKMTPAELRRAADLFDADAAELRLDGMGDDGRWHIHDERHHYNELTDLARKLREEADSRGWQPIETAPRDGTPVLLTDGKRCAVAGFVPQWHEHKEFVRHAKDGDVWRTVREDTGYWNTAEFCPTHWQSLPPGHAPS